MCLPRSNVSYAIWRPIGSSRWRFADRSHHETANLAAKVFELSQSLIETCLRQITAGNAKSSKSSV